MGAEHTGFHKLDYIFSSLKQGRSNAEILGVLEQQEARTAKGKTEGKRLDERGSQSENRVMRIVSNLTAVRKVIRIKKNSLMDKQGYDIVVFFNPEMSEKGFNSAFIQVKSGDYGLSKFKSKLAQIALEEGQPLDGYLKTQRLIILNGQWEEEKIRESFLDQLESFQTR